LKGVYALRLEIQSVNPETLVCFLSGELDLSTVTNFRNKIDQFISNSRISNLVLDFKNLRFIDSSGLAALLGRYKQLAQRGGRVVITHCPSQVRKVLEMSGVTQVIELTDTCTL